MPISRIPSCPPGHIIRESYKTHSGNTVKARCVRKTGILPGKSTEKMKQRINNMNKNSKNASNYSIKRGLSVRSRCSQDQILRRGYTRKSYVRKMGTTVRSAVIAPGCIRKRGKSQKIHGRGPNLFMLNNDDHYLSEYGYHNIEKKTKEERMYSLHKLIQHFIPIKGEMATYNYVIKALNARYILNRNTNPKVARIFKADQRLISKEYNIKKQIT